jgi:aminoglycoside 9-adenylyltransferase
MKSQYDKVSHGKTCWMNLHLIVEKDDKRVPREALQAEAMVQDVLGGSIIGMYLFGSAVIGGLRRDSDVDVLVAADERLTHHDRLDLFARLMAISGKLGNDSSIRPLELTIIYIPDIVPWRYPPRAEFIYGEWLRNKFETGRLSYPGYDPDLAIVLKQVVDHSLPLFGPNASAVFEQVPMTDICKAIRDSLPTLIASLQGDERNVVLTLARMWRTVAVGDVVPKDLAATWAANQLPSMEAALLNKAKMAYLGEANDMWDQGLASLVRHIKSSIEICLNVLDSGRKS